MSAAEIIALVVGLGGFIGAVVSLYNNVTQGQLAKVKQEADTKLAKAKQEADERQTTQDNRNEAFDRELGLLRNENLRLDKSLTDVRAENDRMFTVTVELRKGQEARDVEIFQLKRDLVVERARTLELEKRVDALTAERDGYLAQLQALSRPGTGPLPAK